MKKLYRFSDTTKEYWETWDNGDGTHTIHWGELGTQGSRKTVKASLFKNAEDLIQKEIERVTKQGYAEIDFDDYHTLLIEYSINGMGTVIDLEKRHRLEERMNETLGWTGLGHCDGGSIGSGTMEICNFVVDFDLAKKVIEDDLKETEFSDYSRIYDENI
jgi:hypothetical protein